MKCKHYNNGFCDANLHQAYPGCVDGRNEVICMQYQQEEDP
jgi:hypothetical protein